MKRTRLLLTTGAALIVLVIGLTLHQWSETMDFDEPPQPRGPALVMEGVRAHGFTDNGRPEYWLRALAVNRYQRESGRTLLAMPWLEVRDQNTHWIFEAERGRMEGGNARILLDSAVRARRLSQPPLTLKTEHLIYRPETGEVSAPGPVRIEHEGGHTRAGGLHGRVPEEWLKLIKGVESRYVPAS